MHSLEKTFFYRGKSKEATVMLPDTLDEVMKICDPSAILKWCQQGLLEEARRAAFEVKKKARVVKINLSALSEDQVQGLELLGVLLPQTAEKSLK